MAEFRFIEQPPQGAHPVTAEDLDRVESKFHFSFPRVLRDYYLQYNGCDVIFSQFTRDGDIWDVLEMRAIGKGRWNLEELIRRDREYDFIPDHLIPLAVSSVDGFYYWDTRDEKVYLTYYEEEGDFKLMCTGLDTFFDILNHACEMQDENNLYDITKYSEER
ncbi:MAG: SMI1/KNR4 family protein [Clostridiales bacterium]|nr:SMI1/KNR4 family protein [Clostridiales bacterium]